MTRLLFIYATAFVLCLLIIPSCKKGPDDPFISIKSRKARITGDWDYNSYTLNNFNILGSATITLTIEKDGTYKEVTNMVVTTTEEGTWNFTGGIGNVKRKEQIVMTDKSGASIVWDIIMLKNSEMHWEWEGTGVGSAKIKMSKI